MIESIILHLTDLLQNHPEEIARILLGSLVWDIVGLVLFIILLARICDIEHTLRKGKL